MPSIADFFGKNYKLSQSDNFDNYLKGLGIGLVTRKLALVQYPVISLNKDGDNFVLTSNSKFKNTTTKFKLDEEFEDVSPDGRKIKSTITVNGNILTEIQKDENGKVTTIKRDFKDSEVVVTCDVDDIVCTRSYKYMAPSN